jgi:glycosyltransferase involved in cell wall biosynthesis
MRNAVVFSIVIPCKNESRDISDCLDSVFNQTFPKNKFEVIVVDGGSTDGTQEIIQTYKRVNLVDECGQFRSPSNARNVGAKIARGEIIAFLDADGVYEPIFLEKAFKHFSDPNIDQVIVKTLDYAKKATFVSKCYYAERCASWPKKLIGIQIIRKKVFDTLGGYRSNLGWGEDAELYSRFVASKYKSVYDPNIISYHKEPKSWIEVWQESKWFSKGFTNLLAANPKIGLKRIGTILYRTVSPFLIAPLLINPNIFLLTIVGAWSIENFYRIILAAKRSKYYAQSLFLPIFKTIRYYMLLLNIVASLFYKGRDVGKSI